MALSDEKFLYELLRIKVDAHIYAKGETNEDVLAKLDYYLAVKIIPLLIQKLSDTTIPFDLVDFMESYYETAGALNYDISKACKAENPMKQFESRKRVSDTSGVFDDLLLEEPDMPQRREG